MKYPRLRRGIFISLVGLFKCERGIPSPLALSPCRLDSHLFCKYLSGHKLHKEQGLLSGGSVFCCPHCAGGYYPPLRGRKRLSINGCRGRCPHRPVNIRQHSDRRGGSIPQGYLLRYASRACGHRPLQTITRGAEVERRRDVGIPPYEITRGAVCGSMSPKGTSVGRGHRPLR